MHPTDAPPPALRGRCLVDGAAAGPVLFTDTGLSFWGGVDPATGEVIDRHHPLSGRNVAGAVLAMPQGRGSCSGSAVMLELIMNGRAPAALVFETPDDILALGVIVADEIFGRAIPVLGLGERFRDVAALSWAAVAGDRLAGCSASFRPPPRPAVPPPDLAGLAATTRDRALLSGAAGEGARIAMRIVLRTAALAQGTGLVNVTRVHVDGCIYTGPAGLRFAEHLRDRGARVAVPTTLNAISVDARRWRDLGVDPALGVPATALAQAYLDMGARDSFTCAPYTLDAPPRFGEAIAWSESNAVVFANSVLGARTAKTPDLLDICIALTGRAPGGGPHGDAGRRAGLAIAVGPLGAADDSLYPLLGHAVGSLARDRIPVVTGLEGLAPGPDDLKAFGAAFATTASAPMFHIRGVTPEADGLGDPAGLPAETLGRADLLAAWRQLDTGAAGAIDLVCLGSPHLSRTELERLRHLCRGRTKSPRVGVTVTCGRDTLAGAEADGLAAELAAFGVRLLTDTCWCMIAEPVIPPAARRLMTNSGKYAHYGPGLVGRGLRFGSLERCIEAACTGVAPADPPGWLAPSG